MPVPVMGYAGKCCVCLRVGWVIRYFQGCVGYIFIVVQWLGYMTLNHEIRVQFPAREPCLERLGSQLAYASGDQSRLDILMSSLLLAVSDVLSLTTNYIIPFTVLVVLYSTG